jgi:hypothetical protein
VKQQSTQLPTRIKAGGVCIQAKDWSELNVARIRLPKGLDAAPLFRGLPDNRCQCPHWGTVLRGSIHVTFADGSEEVAYAGEVYYWPAGHTYRVNEDFEAIAFSPSAAMSELIDHLRPRLDEITQFDNPQKESSP